MKAVCIIGSLREHGNTARVVDKIIDGMSQVYQICFKVNEY